MKNKIVTGFVIGCVIIVTIMFFSKLFPFINCSWSVEFCKDWNDLLFGFSCSLLCSFIVAFFMYYYTELRPHKVFSIQVMPILKRKLEIMHETYDFVFEQFGCIRDCEKSRDDDLVKLMKKKNWADKIKKSDRTYGDIVQDTFVELRRLTTEFLTYSRYLDNNQIINIEQIVNMTYCGILTVKQCTSDSQEVQKSILTGKIIPTEIEFYGRDSFIEKVFIPSYRKLLEIEDSFNIDNKKNN